MNMKDLIRIVELEVFFRVGVPAAERAQPQRLLLSLDLYLDASRAAATDDLRWTINYSEVAAGLARFGDKREWQLIETLAVEIAHWVLTEFHPARVAVEVKKFVLPHTQHVSVRVERAGDLP